MYDELIKKAHEAGMRAGLAAIPTPMVVTDTISGQVYEPVSEGPCGFAWIWFKGNTAFGKWMKKKGYAKPHYPTGLYVWVSFFNQSITRKEAYAYEYAKVLREGGIKDAHAGSRLD